MMKLEQHMKYLRTAKSIVLMASLSNIALLVFFIWMAFNPPAFCGKAPDRDLTYLFFAVYSLINFVTLVFIKSKKGVLNIIQRIVFGFNLLLVFGSIAFGIASALESIYSALEIFVTLWLLVPPLITVAGFYSQLKIGVNMPPPFSVGARGPCAR